MVGCGVFCAPSVQLMKSWIGDEPSIWPLASHRAARPHRTGASTSTSWTPRTCHAAIAAIAVVAAQPSPRGSASPTTLPPKGCAVQGRAASPMWGAGRSKGVNASSTIRCMSPAGCHVPRAKGHCVPGCCPAAAAVHAKASFSAGQARIPWLPRGVARYPVLAPDFVSASARSCLLAACTECIDSASVAQSSAVRSRRRKILQADLAGERSSPC
jgi:hypothetical protein